jgi:hypothetical protein
MDFDEFRSVVRIYGARLSCRLANARAPDSEQVDCLDDQALEAGGFLLTQANGRD